MKATLGEEDQAINELVDGGTRLVDGYDHHPPGLLGAQREVCHDIQSLEAIESRSRLYTT